MDSLEIGKDFHVSLVYRACRRPDVLNPAKSKASNKAGSYVGMRADCGGASRVVAKECAPHNTDRTAIKGTLRRAATELGWLAIELLLVATTLFALLQAIAFVGPEALGRFLLPGWVWGAASFTAAALFGAWLSQRRRSCRQLLPEALWQFSWKWLVGATIVTLLMVGAGGWGCVLAKRCVYADRSGVMDRLVALIPFLLLQALPEEIFFREIIYSALSRAFRSPVLAILLQAVPFGLMHADSFFAMPWLFLAAGIWLGTLRLISASIAVPVVAHAVMNLAIFSLFGDAREGINIHFLHEYDRGAFLYPAAVYLLVSVVILSFFKIGSCKR